MRLSTLIVLSLFIIPFLSAPPAVFADIIRLKSGGSVEGVLEKETDEAVTIVVDIGRLTYPKALIESISKSSDEENAKLKEEWEERKRRREAGQEQWKKFVAGQEAKGLILHEGGWITKEEYGKLTKPDAEENKTAAVSKEKPAGGKQEEGKSLKLVDTVKFKSGVDQKTYSYAVRLPAKYNTKMKWPVLFCFDPGGNGEEAARRFAYAAENLGWIVVGSFDARNGPWEDIMSAQEAMLKDIPKRFSVNEKRFYAGGFSGGARMSFSIAYKHPDSFKGVIACGAGFPEGTNYSVSRKVAVYRCVGKTDSNYNEVKDLFGKLHLAGAKEHLYEFEGSHDWPPSVVISGALDWLADQP